MAQRSALRCCCEWDTTVGVGQLLNSAEQEKDCKIATKHIFDGRKLSNLQLACAPVDASLLHALEILTPLVVHRGRCDL